MLKELPQECQKMLQDNFAELDSQQKISVIVKTKAQFASKVNSIISQKFPDASKDKIDRMIEKKWKTLDSAKMLKFAINARDILIRQAQVGSAKREDPMDKKE